LKGGVGLLAALWMKEIKLETVTDEVYKNILIIFRTDLLTLCLIAMGYSAKEKGR
jgi:hypothetical protein